MRDALLILGESESKRELQLLKKSSSSRNKLPDSEVDTDHPTGMGIPTTPDTAEVGKDWHGKKKKASLTSEMEKHPNLIIRKETKVKKAFWSRTGGEETEGEKTEGEQLPLPLVIKPKKVVPDVPAEEPPGLLETKPKKPKIKKEPKPQDDLNSPMARFKTGYAIGARARRKFKPFSHPIFRRLMTAVIYGR